MNQDQVKETLMKIDEDVSEFTVIFSGKSSRKVDGLYHPDTHEIIIHNKNFEDSNSLLYTAIHEFAHHIQFTKHEEKSKRRHHTILFWNIFHKLLRDAEKKGIYTNLFNTDDRFVDLTRKIKDDYIIKNGELMKNFGKLLIQALDLCQQKHAIFEDYVDRALGINRTTAKAAMKIFARDVDPTLGYDNMKVVSSINDPGKRKEAEKALGEGQSQDEVRQTIKEQKASRKAMDEYAYLRQQKTRLEKSIESMHQKLEEINLQLEGHEE